MLASSGLQSILLTHILQFSIAITAVAVVIWITGRRWPHFTFLVCMLALAKCLVPPVITSPAGIFTRHSSLAFSPHLDALQEEKVVQLKQTTDPWTVQAWIPQGTLEWSAPGASSSIHISWTSIVLGIWLLGLGLVASWAAWQYFKLQRLIRRARPASESLRELTKRLQRKLRMRRDVEVLVSEENYGPACVGFFRPKLVIPSVLVSRWSDRLLRPVVAHELVHARRGDIFWGYLQFAAQLIWWFHPLVWWLGRRAHVLCERCCDEEVVASTDCTAGDYAESLVRVLELKSAFRAMPAGHTMSPVEITSQRLERLIKRCGHYSKGTSYMSWVVTAVLAALMIPGMQWAQGQNEEPVYGEKQYRSQIDRALERGEWGVAIDLLRPVVDREPENGGAVFYLGYALHASGNLDEALKYHRRAAADAKMRPTAIYNWACALALKGRSDEALAKLTEALDAGFVHPTDLMDDPDLESLFASEKFKKLRQRTKEYQLKRRTLRQFDFLVGSWEVSDPEGEYVGVSDVSISRNGKVLTESWTTVDGRAGVSISYFHPDRAKWQQIWTDDEGGVIEYEGEYLGGRMQLESDGGKTGSREPRSRVSFIPRRDGDVEQIIENPKNGGGNWRVRCRLRYERRPTATLEELTQF